MLALDHKKVDSMKRFSLYRFKIPFSVLFQNMSTKVCEKSHKTKPKDQFSKTQFYQPHGGQCGQSIETKISSNNPPPAHLPEPNQPFVFPPTQMVDQNMEQLTSHQYMTRDLNISILNHLQQENLQLRLELSKFKKESVAKSVQTSKYADMLPQLHSEIERLRKENDDLRTEITKSRLEIRKTTEQLFELCGNQLQYLMSANERKRKLRLRQLMNCIKDDESLKNQLSPEAKNFLSSLKNKVNSAARELSEDLIKEAIQSEKKPQYKIIFIEMYRLVFGEYEEENEFGIEGDELWSYV
jgi:hypothetical protein